MSNNNQGRGQQIQPNIPRSVRTVVQLANGTFYHFDQEPDEVVRSLEALRVGSEHFARFTGDHREVWLGKGVTEPMLGQMPNPTAILAVMELSRVQVAQEV